MRLESQVSDGIVVFWDLKMCLRYLLIVGQLSSACSVTMMVRKKKTVKKRNKTYLGGLIRPTGVTTLLLLLTAARAISCPVKILTLEI